MSVKRVQIYRFLNSKARDNVFLDGMTKFLSCHVATIKKFSDVRQPNCNGNIMMNSAPSKKLV